MSGLIIKEYQIYCKNFKYCHQWSILTANTHRSEAEAVAIKHGWKDDKDGLWTCPKCLKKMKKQ